MEREAWPILKPRSQKDVEDALDECFGIFADAGGGAGEKKEDIDIGAGIERGAAVAADGYEGDG